MADAWQCSGLGTAMYAFIDTDLKNNNVVTIILWAGVQSSNEKALDFYTKFGYHRIGDFRQDEKDNYDMLKTL